MIANQRSISKAALARRLEVLRGEPLFRIGRTLDVVSLHFGTKIERTSQRGNKWKQGAFVLNVSCFFRLSRQGKILADSRNFPFEEPDRYDSYRTAFDRALSKVNREILPAPVKGVRIGPMGDIHLFLRGGGLIEILATNHGASEIWRIWQTRQEKEEHLVGYHDAKGLSACIA